MDETIKQALAALSKTVNEGFAAMDRGFSAVADDIADIRARMATKDEIADVRREMVTKEELKVFRNETAENFRDVRAEVADIRRAIEYLQTRADNTQGCYSKEIDHLMERVRAH